MDIHGAGVLLLPAGIPVMGAPPADRFGGGSKAPCTYAQLAAAGLLAPASDPWMYFDRPHRAGERRIAGWLCERGVLVRSVGVGSRPTPDAVVDAGELTIEFKTIGPRCLHPAEALYQRIRHARAQSPRVVVDARGTALGRGPANRAVVQALRNGGRDLREVTVLSADFVLSWPITGGA